MKEEIIEGLKIALSKKESLKDAMMSFYNAGYKKEDIEEAARALYAPQPPAQSYKQKTQIQNNQVEQQTKKPVQQHSTKPLPQNVKPTQKISAYEQSSKRNGKTVTIILFILLVLLVAVLATLLIFRNRILDFFQKIFLVYK